MTNQPVAKSEVQNVPVTIPADQVDFLLNIFWAAYDGKVGNARYGTASEIMRLYHHICEQRGDADGVRAADTLIKRLASRF